MRSLILDASNRHRHAQGRPRAASRRRANQRGIANRSDVIFGRARLAPRTVERSGRVSDGGSKRPKKITLRGRRAPAVQAALAGGEAVAAREARPERSDRDAQQATG